MTISPESNLRIISLTEFISTYNAIKQPLLAKAYIKYNAPSIKFSDMKILLKSPWLYNSKLCYGENCKMRDLLFKSIPDSVVQGEREIIIIYPDLYKGSILYKRMGRYVRHYFLNDGTQRGDVFQCEQLVGGLRQSENTTRFHYRFYKDYYQVIQNDRFDHRKLYHKYISAYQILGKAIDKHEDYILENVAAILINEPLPESLAQGEEYSSQSIGTYLNITLKNTHDPIPSFLTKIGIDSNKFDVRVLPPNEIYIQSYREALCGPRPLSPIR